MKIGYFDCFSGASGDMILGSLIDAGFSISDLQKELTKLDVSGYTIRSDRKEKKGIWGTQFQVDVSDHHHHRGLKDIVKLIDDSRLPDGIKQKSKMIFENLAGAEAKIHNKPVDEIHFHEVGAVDSIVDIVGAVIGLDFMRIESIVTSKIHVGTGFLNCAHGTLPVPPPATLELLKEVPVYSTGIEEELVTPTGAAILSTLSKHFGSFPPMQIEQIGYGLGQKDLPIPNLLRLCIGKVDEQNDEDRVQLIETNIDDMNPQFYEYIMESLFAKGAKDVFLIPIIMKKNRPGVVINVIAGPDQVQNLIDILFHETTTLGIRISEIKKRQILKREIHTVSTRWGEAKVKIRMVRENQKMVSPEYEDCKRIAQKNKLPIGKIYEEIKREAEKQLKIKS
ncbi:nickel pincer cofactor biosynthesis protein LarC [bacterium]|nr:nickel pincer cofactor biosynthesis protein LarC [bacterium]RQV97067.1 MAG: nickel pincer cofactor biosynthesis protein LarC [bacterium]